MEILLNQSLINKQPVEMIYLSNKGTLSQRTIRVTKFDAEYVVAFCYERRDVRTFLKSNILFVSRYRRRKRGA